MVDTNDGLKWEKTTALDKKCVPIVQIHVENIRLNEISNIINAVCQTNEKCRSKQRKLIARVARNVSLYYR